MTGIGRRAAVKTFTRNNNKSIQARKGRQATTRWSPPALLRSLTLTPLLILIVLSFGAASAQAEELKPWWHLTTTTLPSDLQPGQAKDTVARIVVNATAGSFELKDKEGEQEAVTVGVNETPEALRESLETEEMYGPGNIEVTSPCTAAPNPSCTKATNEYEVYEIKFVGELAFRPVHMALGGESLEGGSREVALDELAEGRPDGYVVVNATNVGNAPADALEHPVTLTDDLLPQDLEAIGIEGGVDESFSYANKNGAQLICQLVSLSCEFDGIHPKAKIGNRSFYPTSVPPFFGLRMRIAVNFKPGVPAAPFAEDDEAGITGGEAPPASVSRPLTVSSASPPFDASSFEMRPEAAGGAVDTQAGSHPYQLTTTLALNQEVDGKPVALAKDLRFKLPPGLIGNPTSLPRCPIAVFLSNSQLCPPDTAVGAAISNVRVRVIASGGVLYLPFHDAIYNLEPAAGEPARFGFAVKALPNQFVLLNTAVRTGSDYGVTVSVSNVTETAEFGSSEVTFWGVPGAAVHDTARGEQCLEEGLVRARAENSSEPCAALEETNPPPLLSMPTACATNPATGEPAPLLGLVEGDSWQEPTNPFGPLSTTTPMEALAGCDLTLPRFDPTIAVKPDVQEASKPSGLTVDVHVPQEGQLNAEAVAESNVKNIQVTLPAGVTLNPSAADGLEACSGNPSDPAQSPGNEVGFTGDHELNTLPGVNTATFSPHLPGSTDALEAGETAALQPGVNFCPDASKIGEATIKTPLLPEKQPVKGFVYLAAPQNYSVLSGFPQENPFSRHVAMYIVAEDPVSGSLVKLPGKVELGGEPGVEGLAPGQIRSTFENNPQLAFEDAELHFFGGERAPLSTPSRCGSYTTNATFTPWAAEPSDEAQVKVSSSSTFNITSGPNGTPCPGAALPSSPSLQSGTTNNNAGGFSALTTTLSREDGQQNIQSVTLHYPPGLSGLLSSVKLCPEAQANAGTCGPESLIGETIVSIGLGGDPFTVTGGRVYITEKYDGAPFGLSIVNPAKAGPFNLQQGRPVVVRAKIEVDPYTAALTITTDPSGEHAIPTMIEGFPLQIKHVNVLVNRPGFTFNPTNCVPASVTGAIDSAEGASSPVSVPFQVTNCAVLKFTPKFNVSTAGHTSKALGASLTAKVSEPSGSMGSQSNIAAVKVDLPRALPSRLKTLQKACTNAQFNANPANCPAASFIGHAVVHTPLLPVPLEGPAIFVSHGGEAFPSLTMVLQGDNVTIDLVGATYISPAGITSTTFKTVPDAPFNTFELTLPEGPYSALAANGNLCAETKMVTVSKKLKIKVKGHSKTVTRKVKQTKPESLVMPTAFIAQNGATLNQDTHIEVTGCPKAKPAKKPAKHKTKAKHKK
jgi:hypothetical protein